MVSDDCAHTKTNVVQVVDKENAYRVYCVNCTESIGPYEFSSRHDAQNAEQMFWLGKGMVK